MTCLYRSCVIALTISIRLFAPSYTTYLTHHIFSLFIPHSISDLLDFLVHAHRLLCANMWHCALRIEYMLYQGKDDEEENGMKDQ